MKTCEKCGKPLKAPPYLYGKRAEKYIERVRFCGSKCAYTRPGLGKPAIDNFTDEDLARLLLRMNYNAPLSIKVKTVANPGNDITHRRIQKEQLQKFKEYNESHPEFANRRLARIEEDTSEGLSGNGVSIRPPITIGFRRNR